MELFYFFQLRSMVTKIPYMFCGHLVRASHTATLEFVDTALFKMGQRMSF
jgi:hypothetical protein